VSSVHPPLRAAVLASGGGSNFEALVTAQRQWGSAAGYEVVALVADREGAGALGRAAALGIEAHVVASAGRSLDAIGLELVQVFEQLGVELVLLAGYLRLVPPQVVQRWSGRIVNVHPALLPAFGGKGMWGHHVHEAVLGSGARLSGPTVHLVDERYDEGRILAQWPIAVRADDTPASLAQRVLQVEHRLYPLVARHLCHALIRGEAVQPLVLGSDLLFPELLPENSSS